MNIRGCAARNGTVNGRAAVILGLLLSCGVAGCTPDKRPVAFSNLSGQRALVHEHLGGLYRIIVVDNREQRYTPPKYLGGLEGQRPPAGHDTCVPEHAWILFIVTAEGAVAAPQVVDTSPNLSSKVAIERIEPMRFQPATLDGKPVAAVADYHLGFNCMTELGHRQ
jgi:hypothetical protein